MGWNSFDCFGSAVTEDEVRANALLMARNLSAAGWRFVVVDFCWSHPSPGACANPHIGPGCQPLLCTDLHGRLVPAPNRFPSAAGGAGFRPLADFVHDLGLKFGIHMMRGIPRQVCAQHMLIEGTGYLAREASTGQVECPWLDHMFSINTAHPSGQAYYDSVFRLYASWGVDFVKVDDILGDGTTEAKPHIYHADEVEAIRRAIDRAGRPMVLSLSPGDASPSLAEHLRRHADMWRISSDFWDSWSSLKRMFGLCETWWSHRAPGGWPDADMLPLGRICKRGPQSPERDSRFSPVEARTLLTLWSIFRSPLMIGGHLPETDPGTLGLLTNTEVLDVNQRCLGGRPIDGAGTEFPVWLSDYPDSQDRALALFNLGETGHTLHFHFEREQLRDTYAVRDLWERRDLGRFDKCLSINLPPHGAGLFRLTTA